MSQHKNHLKVTNYQHYFGQPYEEADEKIMAQPQPNSDSHTPPGKNAEILPFKARSGEEEADPEELTLAECVSLYIHKWNHPGLASRPIVDAIITDTINNNETDAWQERLQQAIDKSPLYDHYDDIRDSDPVTLLLESLMRSTQNNSLELERKAIRKLMDMRATQIVEQPDQDLKPQLARLPLGDEELWLTVAERLAKQE